MQELNEFNITINRSKRRSLAIYIDKGQVRVAAPLRMDIKIITDFIEKKSAWIRKKIQQQQSAPVYQTKQYSAGEIFLYFGLEYRLLPVANAVTNVQLEGNNLLVSSGKNAAMLGNHVWMYRQLARWYQQQAFSYLLARTEFYSAKLGLKFQSVKIKSYKSRWGSCSTEGHIDYNWLIILAPPAIIDYLVVHELCHLKHHNHSAAFWQLVASEIPDFKACRNWLKEHGHTLRID